ncbi:MAG: DotU family type IV/VI secretion system protein [Desulfovibrio sp.]|nr:DotU family type IV/VI secretion system protein [Desulfovibrio sp.]
MALVDRFLPAAAFAALLAREEEMREVAFATARADMDRLLAEAVADTHTYRPEDVDSALFAVCAFADEAVLASDWPGRGEWLRRSLQRERFGTVNAGEEFYVRLAELCEQAADERAARSIPASQVAQAVQPAQAGKSGQPGQSNLGAPSPFFEDEGRAALREVLEVYAACLTLGFTGRYYGDAGRERLAAITRESLDRLMVRGPGLGGKIFPEAYADRQPTPPPPLYRQVARMAVFVVVPLLTALYLHGAYAALLTAWVQDWLRALG